MWNHLKAAQKPIWLYGMGNGADLILDHAARLDVPIRGVFASNAFVRGQSFRGYPVRTYRQAAGQSGPMIVLLAFGTHRPEVMENILQIAGQQELYAPDFPVCGGPLFSPAFARAHQPELQAVYEALADSQSRLVLESVCRFKLSGELAWLRRCESSEEEVCHSILPLSPQEDYVDLGAYRGDTLAAVLRRAGACRSILAMEPDPRSFRHLQQSFSSLANCRLINRGAWSHPCVLPFAGNTGRGGTVSAAGRSVPMDSVDHLLQGSPASYIKIDVEGSESEAVAGAAETIRRWKPRLCVAAYHRSADLFRLPLQILSLRPDYRVYLRHFPCFPSWDVNYYFV